MQQVRDLAGTDTELYCWSTSGAEYARGVARQLGIEDRFKGFLPKPNILIDDQVVSDWKGFAIVHPLSVSGKSAEEFRAR